jgi:shikimate kinase
MLVGPPNGGKSCMCNTLASAVNLYLKNLDPKEEITNNEIKNLKEITHTCINPKSITKEELYGLLDNQSGDWKEGLASSIMKR